jgi:hypothetical protein
MILLDNLLKYLLFIAMIDVFRTCDNTTALICNALVIFMIYPWIKIKLKVCCNTVGKKNRGNAGSCLLFSLQNKHITCVTHNSSSSSNSMVSSNGRLWQAVLQHPNKWKNLREREKKKEQKYFFDQDMVE